MASTRMISLRLPHDLLDRLDEFLVEGERTAFIIAAIEEKLSRDRLISSIKSMEGMVAEDDAPYWSTPEKITHWVQAQRSINAEKGIERE